MSRGLVALFFIAFSVSASVAGTAQTTPSAIHDCGAAWTCFEQSLEAGQPASINVAAGSEAPPLHMRIDEFDAADVTATFDSAGASGSCRVKRVALQGIVEDAMALGSLSPLAFAIADQCRGQMFTWWPPAHLVVASLAPAASIPGSTDCGWSTSCLIGHVRNKTPASARLLTTIPLFGVLITTVSTVKVDHFADVTALAYLRTDANTAVLLPETIASMKAQGKSDSDVRKAQADASTSAASVVGHDGSCRIKDAALTTLLTRWYGGSYSTEDWNAAESCTGTMFANWHKGT